MGTDPETGRPVTVRIGRSSVYVQRGEGGEGDRATLPVDLLVDDLDAEKVRELLHHRSRADEPLGIDPATGARIFMRIGPYGPYLQLGEGGGEAKPKRVSLPRGRKPADVDLDYAIRLLALPRLVGIDPETGERVTAGIGRFGPYVERAGTYRNLTSEEELFTVTVERARELLASKGKRILKELGPHPDSGRSLQIMAGKYGPYLTDGELNASLPRDLEPADVELAQAVSILAEKGKPPARKGGRRGAGARAGAAVKGAKAKTGRAKAVKTKTKAAKTKAARATSRKATSIAATSAQAQTKSVQAQTKSAQTQTKSVQTKGVEPKSV